MARTGLLDTLGLSAPPWAANKGIHPDASTGTGPTGPLRQPGDLPRDEVRRTPAPAPPKDKGLDDAALTKALKSLPSDPIRRADALADLVTKVSDTARRDPIVKALRDTLAKIQPFVSDKEAKKKLDQAITDLVEKGAKAALKALLTAAAGRAPTEVDRDKPRDVPTMEERDLKERIVKTPPLPLPIDKPPPLKVLRFRLEVPPSVKPSKYFDFKLTTPDGFKPDDKRFGATWVLIAAKEVYEKNAGIPPFGRGVHVQKPGRQTLSHVAPDEPGRYVIFVKVGPSNEASSAEEFEVR